LNNSGETKQADTFKLCPNNHGLLVGRCVTIKNSITGEVLEQILSERGYWMVKNPLITPENPREYEYVHRLVALTYVPGYSYMCWICHHKDKNHRNNIPENLIWCSPEAHQKIHWYYPWRMSA
jgi:hypothetical protein